MHMYETNKIHEIAEKKAEEIAGIQHSILSWLSLVLRSTKVPYIWKNFWKKKVLQ